MKRNRLDTPIIWAILPTGRANAMHAAKVADLSGLKSRQEVSAEVYREHEAGYPICASYHGYYRPATPAELDKYIRSRRRRAQSTAAGTAQLMQAAKHYFDAEREINP